jgi:hypothetical protein
MTPFTLQRLQMQSQKNFWDKRDPFTGIVEELGELVDAQDRVEDAYANQAVLRRFGVDPTEAEHNARLDVFDACADVVIYMADLTNLVGFDLSVIGREEERGDIPCLTELLKTVGRAAHAKLKLFQGIRGTPEMHRAMLQAELIQLYNYCRNVFYMTAKPLDREVALHPDKTGHVATIDTSDFLNLVEAVWARVSKRDWKADPVKGGET